jgi:hypothetical protein
MAVFHLLHRLLMPQASTKCPFQLTTKFVGFSNIEHSFNTYISKIANFYITTLFLRIYTRKKQNERRIFGGDERIRTADLPRAKRSLCQLSYTPELSRRASPIMQNKSKSLMCL